MITKRWFPGSFNGCQALLASEGGGEERQQQRQLSGTAFAHADFPNSHLCALHGPLRHALVFLQLCIEKLGVGSSFAAGSLQVVRPTQRACEA